MERLAAGSRVALTRQHDGWSRQSLHTVESVGSAGIKLIGMDAHVSSSRLTLSAALPHSQGKIASAMCEFFTEMSNNDDLALAEMLKLYFVASASQLHAHMRIMSAILADDMAQAQALYSGYVNQKTADDALHQYSVYYKFGMQFTHSEYQSLDYATAMCIKAFNPKATRTDIADAYYEAARYAGLDCNEIINIIKEISNENS